jgi:putative addiction module component (TIGR02574 family)
MSAAEILEQIRRLPEAERREVIERIEDEFVELDGALPPEKLAELERRAQDALKNPGRGTPAAEVHSDVKKRLPGKR